MRVWLSLLCVGFLALPALQCAKAPPQLSPVAATAFQNHQIQRVLDLLRDTAIDGNATTPPVISEPVTRKVVTWHRDALLTLHARAEGWKATLTTGLDELLNDLSAADQQKFTPYVALAKVLIQEAP